MRHIHWFRKTIFGSDPAGPHIMIIRYKQCRCGNLKIIDFYSYLKALEKMTGIPKEKLTGLEVGRITSEINE